MSAYPTVIPANVDRTALSGADCLCRFKAGGTAGRTGDAAAFLRARPTRW